MADEWLPNREVSGIPFLQKLRDAVAINLDFWEARPDNLSRQAFERILPLIPDSIQVNWEVRKSQAGDHGYEGEDMVFEFEFSRKALGRNTTYYVKGYFFTPNQLRGVTIQSFRPARKAPIPFPLKPRGRR